MMLAAFRLIRDRGGKMTGREYAAHRYPEGYHGEGQLAAAEGYLKRMVKMGYLKVYLPEPAESGRRIPIYLLTAKAILALTEEEASDE